MRYLAIIATLLLAGPCLAQDADGDGIPDAVEYHLGSDPGRAEQFTLLHHDGTAGQDDETLAGDFAAAPDFVDVSLAAVAQDRWLWRITFAADYVGDGNTCILYLDVDRDLTTGRQESDSVRGTDLMYTQQNGEFGLAEHTPGLRTDPLRMAVVGDAIYICADSPLGQGNAQGLVRFKVLSHVSPPNSRDADTMEWMEAPVPAAVDARKPRIGMPPPVAPVATLSTDRPDADGDGIPDMTERVLGMDPDHADAMHLILEDPSVAEGDEMPENFAQANDLTDVYFGNAAGDRWVWRVDFADDFRTAGTILIVYLDCDNDLTTGRQDGMRGTDIMMVCQNGGFDPSIRNPEVLSGDGDLRGLIDGASVWLSMDLRMNINAEGNSEFRTYVLSQYRPTSGDDDSSGGWSVVCGPGESDRDRPRVSTLSEILSEGVYVEQPWLSWREQLREMDAVTADLTAAEMSGMRLEDRSLVADEEGARASIASPVSGAFHLNIVLQDSAQRQEQVAVRVGGRQVADLVAADNDGLIHLFSTVEPVIVREGELIEFICDGPAQDARISELTFTRELPAPPGLTISHVGTFCAPDQQGETVDVDVCFLTNMACVGAVSWGEGDALDRAVSEEQPTHNHRLRLTGLRRGATYRFAPSAGSGVDRVSAEPETFVAEPLRIERCGIERAQVALAVADPVAGRPAWPVSGGVPIPRGQLRDAAHCRVLQDGQPVAADFRELAWWPDGSVKWLLVSLLHTGGDYVLEYGQSIEAAAIADPIQVEETADGLRVTTDVLRADISRERFSPPGDLWRDLNGDGQFAADEQIAIAREGAVLVDAEGNRYSTAGQAAQRLVIEESGPVRTVLLAEGRFAGDAGELLGWRCRLYFYRGFAGVPTVFTLIGDEGDSIAPPTMTMIRSLTVPVQFAHEFTDEDFLPLPEDPQERAAVEQARRAVLGGMRMLHDYDNRYLVITGDQVEEREGHKNAAVGLVHEAAGVRRTLAVTMRDFWQMYPKAYSVQGSRLVAEIFPALPADQYADQEMTPLEKTQHYYWFRDGAYMIPMGVALSYDLLFYAYDDTAGKEIMDEAWDSLPLLTASPEWVCGSGAFADLEPERPGVFESYQAYVDEGFDALEARRERVREYDWMNFGDTHGERVVNWTNQEYDLQWGLLVQFARSGDWRFFDRGEQAARHTAAVDTVSVAPSESLLGLQKAHSVGHTGGHDIERPPNTTYWFTQGIWNTGHMWTQGTLTAYCLTGDRRYYDAAMLLADWLAREKTRYLPSQVHRAQGWTTIACLGGYETLPDPWYLNAARLFSQNAIARQDPGTGAFIHGIGECEHEVRHVGGKTFMTGVVMTGMKMLDQVDPDPDLKNSIVRSADWIAWRMWHPWDNSFQYAQCTQFDQSSTHAGTYMACEGLAYAWDLSPRPIYREMLERSLADMILNAGPSGSGKGYAMQIRMTPFALSAMQRWGMTELPAPPPPEPEIGMGDTVYLPPDRPGLLAVSVNNRGRQELPASAAIVELPDGISAEPMRVQWNAPAGVAVGPSFALSGAGEGQVRVRCRVGESEDTLTATLRPARPIEIGDAVGMITGPEEPVGLALAELGIAVEALPDLRPETLAGYGALLVGSEAHEKDLCGLRADWPALMDFVHSGGRIAVMQLQNTSYQPGFLPLPLVMSNDSAAFGEIAAAEHPIFTTPNAIASLAGVISYDTITAADPGWTVLATDSNGNPAVLSTRSGGGEVLVVQPSPDRYVLGRETPGEGLTVEACGRFLTNIVEWLRAR